jgi:hypothetical protein
MGVIGPFGGDFDTWPVVDKPGINVLYGCLPKSKTANLLGKAHAV